MSKTKSKSKCPFDDPDCFECPFDDCKATLRDLNRQSAVKKKQQIAQRNDEIIQAFLNNATVDGLAERYNVKKGTITGILNKQGIYVKKKGGPK